MRLDLGLRGGAWAQSQSIRRMRRVPCWKPSCRYRSTSTCDSITKHVRSLNRGVHSWRPKRGKSAQFPQEAVCQRRPERQRWVVAGEALPHRPITDWPLPGPPGFLRLSALMRPPGHMDNGATVAFVDSEPRTAATPERLRRRAHGGRSWCRCTGTGSREAISENRRMLLSSAVNAKEYGLPVPQGRSSGRGNSADREVRLALRESMGPVAHS